ncbi:hypothetical protein A3G56_01250 [Candidatus Falkowbacteria bacterium RIFCSPLOWO2_12_FULL_45_10]|uniref:Hydrolase TatD n=1 Tax=Candidatus Falkowbacteria bacterium RIFCSPLOWO2_12_FULL_45_10 TaxID=1797990 RepID=A0A1F5RY19_9BACT|nr:MAG: hypothetical protein A3G56_01250 [Candidatus Falkowbacteria bacterium RIFCSPLOWO2_12_FULL_45_10]
MTDGLQLVDTHCHLNFGAFKDDSDAVIRRALDARTEMIIVGAEHKSSKRAITIATRYDRGVYAAVGLHPVHLQETEFKEEGTKVTTKAESFDRDFYEQLAISPKVVAIGEIGLDYYYLSQENAEAQKKLQQETLRQQLRLAYDLDKPAIIHCREAHDDLLPLLDNFCRAHRVAKEKLRGVLHCFSGNWDLAWQYFALGFLISFTGLITFNDSWDELIRKCPLDKLMIETDSPFMSPAPFRGQRNEPARVVEAAKKIAELKNIKLESVAQATTENASNLFKI